LVFLPPYSPDFNPIEEFFSSLKAWLRHNRDYVVGELSGTPMHEPHVVLLEGVCSVMPEKALGWFRHAGY
ncbi:hypothetical protein BS47DRAFT_1272959, partial [Hydnum rufescens UP504]